VDLQQKGQARRHRTSSEAKNSGQRIQKGECVRCLRREMGQWVASMVCRVEGEGRRCKKMGENLQQREQRDGPPSSGGGALSPPRCVCHQQFIQDGKKRKNKGKTRGRWRGGDVGCEELPEATRRRMRGGRGGVRSAGVVWRGAGWLLTFSNLEKKEGDGKNPGQGWCLNRFPGGPERV
jgi:hypothetical protein